jgi:hypothetical protein
MEDFFDDNIKQLCKEIREIVPLRFEKHDEHSYNATINKANETGQPIGAIVWYYDPLSLSKLAHELYHIKIGLVLGDNEIMLPNSKNSQYTRFLLSYDFCEEFLNHVEHFIFYPIYKAQGYSDDEFFENINPDPFDAKLNEIAKQGVKKSNGEYVLIRVADYFRLMVLFMFFPIDARFKNRVRQLKHIDIGLFNLFKGFKDIINGMDIEPNNRQKLQNAYASFLSEIEKWTLNHAFDSLPILANYEISQP